MTSVALDGSARRERLAEARLYLCTDARSRHGDLAEFLDAVLAAGVDVIQLRHKGLEAAAELDLLAVLRAACRRHDALLAVNDRADLAVLAEADVLHLGQRDLTPQQARALVGPDVLLGRSSHTAQQADRAAGDPDVDYFCAGPVWATPTKPGRAGTGLKLLQQVASRDVRKPWFAIGGVDCERLPGVLAAGAERVVVVRAVTQSADAAAAVRRIRAML